MERKKLARLAGALALGALAHGAMAAEWSDTSIGFRFGNKYREPFNSSDVSKRIISFTHADGYKYGSNFLNIDLLNSDGNDANAQEAYVVYRHTLDLGKVTGRDFKYGPMSALGLTAGFDWNTKNDPGYGSRKRMLVLGPTATFGLATGFVNVGVLLFHESNQPAAAGIPRYTYDNHAALDIAYNIGLGAGFNFQGYTTWIGAKGKDEFGNDTSPEFHFDSAIMYDLSPHVRAPKNTFKVGFEYEYWRNKFGNPHGTVPGAFARTPQIRLEYHF